MHFKYAPGAYLLCATGALCIHICSCSTFDLEGDWACCGQLIWARFSVTIMRILEPSFLIDADSRRILQRSVTDRHCVLMLLVIRFLKPILLFCIEKWGMRISKHSLLKIVAFLCILLKNGVLKFIRLFCIEKWGYLETLFWKKNYILMYCIDKLGFWSRFFCFVLKNEEWRFLKALFWKFCIIIILKN